jgi:hypothetical protein
MALGSGGSQSMADLHISRQTRPQTRPSVRYQGTIVRDDAVC